MQDTTDTREAAEHILNWIESSFPHYKHLKRIAHPGNFMSDINRAHACTMLAVNGLQAMIKGGDAHKSNHSASTVLLAAVMISEWKAPE